MDHVFAIVDCASFYTSCERVFRPGIRNAPVVVLSNNDGCVIARSEEVKGMAFVGGPYFKIKEQLDAIGTHVFSSNYDLYGDMSRRVMDVLSTFTNDLQVYSIDEAFLKLPALSYEDLIDLGHQIKDRVMRWTGIPVRVGIGPTRTLAKASQALGKKWKQHVVSVAGREDVENLLAQLPIGDLWGIGRRHAKRLNVHGVKTALDLRNMDDAWIRHYLSIVGLRTAKELRGISCLDTIHPESPRHSILRSRSFGKKVTELPVLREAVAHYASWATEELRQHAMTARFVQIFLTVQPHSHASLYTQTGSVVLEQATNYTPDIISAALAALEKTYRSGCRYAKAGIVLLDLTSEKGIQGHLFAPYNARHTSAMSTVDAINQRMGTNAIYFARAGLKIRQAWAGRCEMRSPRYTTQWKELATAKA